MQVDTYLHINEQMHFYKKKNVWSVVGGCTFLAECPFKSEYTSLIEQDIIGGCIEFKIYDKSLYSIKIF